MCVVTVGESYADFLRFQQRQPIHVTATTANGITKGNVVTSVAGYWEELSFHLVAGSSDKRGRQVIDITWLSILIFVNSLATLFISARVLSIDENLGIVPYLVRYKSFTVSIKRTSFTGFRFW